MKTYNHEIKVLMDLKYRHATIHCHGGYGNNPSVLMISSTSTIVDGFIKDVETKAVGKDNDGKYIIEKWLIVDSEYGHEIKLPYDKIIGMTILSSKEQAMVKGYELTKDDTLSDTQSLIEELTSSPDVAKDIVEKMIQINKEYVAKCEELIANGVKVYK